jgi:hypothetical protein
MWKRKENNYKEAVVSEQELFQYFQLQAEKKHYRDIAKYV